MRKNFASAPIFKLTTIFVASALVLSSLPASGAALSAKPSDKTPGASAKGGPKATDTTGASVQGANPNTGNPNSSKPESAQEDKSKGSKPQASANNDVKVKATPGAANTRTTSATAKATAKAKARKDARLATSDYIIVFKPAANLDEEIRGLGALKANVGKRFDNAFKGVLTKLNEKQLAGLSNNPNISIIEKDAEAKLIEPVTVTSQANAPWGLDRIDQLSGRDSVYNFSFSGSGVTAYVIDTGILSSHSNFGGRVLPGFSSIAGGTEDCNGHGTHVAGTIGSATFGVAKSVQLVPVRVLDCNGSGTISGVIAGVDWVASQTSVGVKVANMSLGGGASSALDAAVEGLISKGTTVVVAAGNSGANACNYSPARVPAAITVAASTSSDALASYSNRGSCVDIIAPGSSIVSTWHTSSSATNTISGTSMASPHVAGAVALFFQQFGFKTPAEMDQILKTKGSKNVFSSLPSGTPNLLLHTDPTNQIPLTPTEEVAPAPTTPTKGANKPRRTRS
jgi:subtilisin family serine protease